MVATAKNPVLTGFSCTVPQITSLQHTLSATKQANTNKTTQKTKHKMSREKCTSRDSNPNPSPTHTQAATARKRDCTGFVPNLTAWFAQLYAYYTGY